MIKVSVIVPVYNMEKYLDICLSSLANQTFKDYEVILINDGTYIVCEDGNKTIYGEAYLLKDGQTTQICKNNKKEKIVEELELILPTIEYKEQIEKYKQDMLDSGSSMDGCGSLRNDDFDTWLQKSNDWREGKNLPEGFVPSTQYICIRKSDNKVIGMFQIRHTLSDFLFNFGGHVGDSIAVDERNKGYGKKLLALGLEKCKELGIEKVLVTCKDTNIASRKCILANDGVYEDTRTIKQEGINLERYWIDNSPEM